MGKFGQILTKIVGFVLLTKTCLLAQMGDPLHKYYSVYEMYSVNHSGSIKLRISGNQHYHPSNYIIKEMNWQKAGNDGEGRSFRNVPNDLVYAGKIFFGDFKHVYSSPVRWSKGDWLWFCGFTLATGMLFIYDQEILDGIQRNRNAFGLKQILEIGEFFEPMGHMGVMNKYYFAGLGTGYIFNIRPLILTSGEILESHFIAAFFNGISKVLVGRNRPFEDKGPYSFSFTGGTSFPSGHAINISQLATVLSYHIRFLPFQIFAYTVAVSVALQRIDSGNHWPSDVFLGAVFGTWVSKVVLNYHNIKGLTITPQLSLEHSYLGLQFTLKK